MSDRIKALNAELLKQSADAQELLKKMTEKSEDGKKAYDGWSDDLATYNAMVEDGTKKREFVKSLIEQEKTDEFLTEPTTDATPKAAGQQPQRHKSWGQEFAESQERKSVLEANPMNQKPEIRVEFERKDLYEGTNPNAVAVSTSQGGVLINPDRDDQIRLQPQRPLTILDVVLTIPTGSNAVEYLVEGDFTNNAAGVAEKALKPESDASFKQEVARIKTIAHWIRVTRQMLEDAPRIRAYIDNRLTVKLKQKLEDQVVDGDGAGENLLGLLRTVGLLSRVHGVASNGIGGAGDNKLDTIRHGITDLQSRFFTPDVIIFNEFTSDDLETLKDDQGRYLERYDPVTQRLWRLRTVVSPAMKSSVPADGKISMVMDTRMSVELYDRRVYAIYTGQPNDFMLRNQFAILAEGRWGMGAPYPLGMQKITGF